MFHPCCHIFIHSIIFKISLHKSAQFKKLTLCATIEYLRLAWHKIHRHKFTIHINKINSHNVESHYTQKFSSYINSIPNKTSFVVSFESLEIYYIKSFFNSKRLFKHFVFFIPSLYLAKLRPHHIWKFYLSK
jgi:hypothetical protein